MLFRSALYIWGQFNDHVLVDFLEQYKKPVEFAFRRFNRPLFRGLETDLSKDWNHVLWAIEHEHWEPFKDHILAATLIDQANRHIYQTALQEFDIVDPLFMDRAVLLPPVLPMVPVKLFAVRSDIYQAAFEEGTHPLMSPPRLRFFEPQPACKMYAEALFGDENPQLAVHLMEATVAQRKETYGDTTGLPTGNERGSGSE